MEATDSPEGKLCILQMASDLLVSFQLIIVSCIAFTCTLYIQSQVLCTGMSLELLKQGANNVSTATGYVSMITFSMGLLFHPTAHKVKQFTGNPHSLNFKYYKYMSVFQQRYNYAPWLVRKKKTLIHVVS